MTCGNDKFVTVHLPADLADQLEQLTQAAGEDQITIMVSALRAYMDAKYCQVQDIEEAIAEADRGEFATASDVNSFFTKYSS